MTIVNVIEEQNLNKYLVITQQKDPSSLITTRVLITDNINNRISLINIERGMQGDPGPQGPKGDPGKDGIIFDILPISSGGTNAVSFSNDKIIFFDGTKLASSNYSVNDLIDNQNAITGIIAGSGLSKIESGKNVTLNTRLGDGLTLSNNNIIVDDTIARKAEISLGTILPGAVPINKGGTNNTNYNTNSLIYFDGTRFSSFPLATGRLVTSGSIISILAGSGLIGGGNLSLPGGSVVINIPESSDIAVLDNLIELTATGTPGTYTKVTTDAKGRVVSGTQLNQSDILSALGYTPWHPNNDGENSGLDADLLDGRQGSYYLNFNNLTGTISTGILPSILNGGIFSKVTVNNKGLVIGGTGIEYQDVIDALGYYPVNRLGDTIDGDLNILGNLNVTNNLTLGDNLPEFGYNNYSLLPNAPRGFSFTYGSISRRTGILAYYPDDNQLRLITNIFGTGITDLDGSDSDEDNFNGDVDGGDASSVYLLGNIDGDQAVVLLQHIADKRYVSLTQDQIINGIKTFTEYLTIGKALYIQQGGGYSGPPLFIGSNTALVESLNSDLLDSQHGFFYRDAINLTGVLDYRNVRVTHLSGTQNYLPKFDSRTDDPSQTINDSIVFQSGNSLIFVEDGSISVGTTNQIVDSESVAIGYQNKITTNNSLAVGYKNITSGINSIALNYSSATKEDNSVAMGTYGTTWMENQLSIGAFEELSDVSPIRRIGHGQQSTAAIGYRGSPGSAYESMSPIINIPNNKTMLYDISLLFTKLGSSGVASFVFNSGIVKNTAGEVVSIKDPVKQEIFNDSQIRDYLYNIVLAINGNNQNQTLSVTKPPIRGNDPEIQNLYNVYRLKPELSEISGQFLKTFDGNMVLDMYKPISSGWFSQPFNTNLTYIKSYNHGTVAGSFVNVNYVSGISGYIHTPTRGPSNSGLMVAEVFDEHNFGIVNPFFGGHHEIDGKIFVPYSNLFADPRQNIFLSGDFTDGSPTITNIVLTNNNRSIDEVMSNILPNMVLSIFNLNAADVLNYPIRVSSVTDGPNFSINMDQTYFGDSTSSSFALDNYAIFSLENSKRIFLSAESYNQTIDISELEFVSSGIKFDILGYAGGLSIQEPVKVFTMNPYNTGSLIITKKRSYNCDYKREKTRFYPYQATYTHNKSISGISDINFLTEPNKVINFASSNYNPYVVFLTATNSFSGILTSGSNTITNCNPIQDTKLIPGLILHARSPDFYYTGIVESVASSSVTMNNIFDKCPGSTGLFIVYSGDMPPSYNYPKTNIILDGSGYIAQRTFLSPNTGIYFTGEALIYSNYGQSDISITGDILFNVANDEIVYLDFITNNIPIRPLDGNYITSGCQPKSFSVISNHLLPDSGTQCFGRSKATLDKDHGYLDTYSIPDVQQQIPIIFEVPTGYIAKSNLYFFYDHINNIDRKPKNNILSITGVDGHKLYVSDSRYQLLKEVGKLPLYDNYSESFGVFGYIDSVFCMTMNEKPKYYLVENDKILVNKFKNTLLDPPVKFKLAEINTSTQSNFYKFQCIDNDLSRISNYYSGVYQQIYAEDWTPGSDIPVLELLFDNSQVFSTGSTLYVEFLTFSGSPFSPQKTGLIISSGGPGSVYGVSNFDVSSFSKTGLFLASDTILNSGLFSYIQFQDGIVRSPLNAMYFHSYGSGSEYWGKDIFGNYVYPPKTGFFVKSYNNKLCNSGTLCVSITGIGDNSLSNISIGKNLFFDFIDTDPVITGIFSVHDKPASNLITINIPLQNNENDYVTSSGLVYIIDSLINIKTNKNPNIDNSFILSSFTDDIDISSQKLSSYNYYNNRWKHGLFFDNDKITQATGVRNTIISVDHEGTETSKNTNVIILDPIDLSFSVSYSGLNNGQYIDLDPLPGNPPISIIEDSNTPISFMVKINNGAGRWSSNVAESAPRINILGLKDYEIASKLYDEQQNAWLIKINSTTPLNIVNSKNIKFIVSDESGRVIKDFKVTTEKTLTVSDIENTEYGYINNLSIAKMHFEIYGGVSPYSVSANLGLLTQKANYTTIFEDLPSSAECTACLLKINGLFTDSDLGDHDIILQVTDNIGRSITSTGILTISSSEKQYTPSIRAFKNSININKFFPGTNNNISFLMPCRQKISSPVNVSFIQNSLSLNSLYTAYYDSLDAYFYRININVGFSTPNNFYTTSFTGSILQPQGGIDTTYNFGSSINVTVFEPIGIDTQRLAIDPLSSDVSNAIRSDKDAPLVLSLDIINGAQTVSSTVNRQLRAYVGNTPNIGRYMPDSDPLEYKISYSYIQSESRHRALISGKPDLFGEYALSTGLKYLYYYIEDYTSYATGYIPIMITGGLDLINLHAKKYSTPNNDFNINFDIEGFSYNIFDNVSKPNISIPGNRKDSFINLSQQYGKYDPHTKVWEYFYSGDPILEKWDAIVELNGSNLDVKVKGLSSDKIYVAGRLDTVETDNVIFVERPFKITGVKPPLPPKEEDAFTEGDSWKITFKTIGGIEDPNYPPKIILGQTPGNSCFGFDPALPNDSQICSKPPVWITGEKAWSYEFNGPPLCIIGIQPQTSIIAQDIIGSTIYATDTSGTVIIYKSGEAHPDPTIESFSDGTLYPNCTYYRSKNLNYNIEIRDYCPQPTGITGVVGWGDLPAGITFHNSRQFTPYTKDQYGQWSDLTGGYVYFDGTPTEYANGGSYNYKYYVGVIDARGQSGKIEVVFNDGSKPIETSPTDVTIYFDKPGYSYTPSTGTKFIQNETQKVVRPPADPFSMKCLSKLPHNKCAYGSGYYSATNDNRIIRIDTPLNFVTDSNSPKYIGNNGKVYVQFTGLLTGGIIPASDINGIYTVIRYNGQPDDVYISGNYYNYNNYLPTTGGIEILNINNNLKDKSLNQIMSDYFTTEDFPLTTIFSLPNGFGFPTGLMGSGTLSGKDGSYGIYGKIKPSFVSTIDDYPIETLHLEKFFFSRINQEKLDPYIIEFNNCYETGYLRISGIVLPKFFINITDPPPAQNNLFTNSQSEFAVTVRSAYMSGQFDNKTFHQGNGRSVSIDYLIKDELYDTNILDNNLSTNNEGFGSVPVDFKSTALAPLVPDTGTLLSLTTIYNSNAIFPTFNRNNIPSASSIVYWIHTSDDGSSFPPVYPLDKFNLVIPTGSNTNKKFQFAGGHISQSYPYTDHPPHVTGYIQITNQSYYSGIYEQIYSSDWTPDSGVPLLELAFDTPHIFGTGDALHVEFLTFSGTPFIPEKTGLIISSGDQDFNIRYGVSNFNINNTSKTGLFLATDLYQIYQDNIDSNNLNIRFNSGVPLDMVSVNTGIDLIDYRDETQSLLGYYLPVGGDPVNKIKVFTLADNIATINNIDPTYYSNLLIDNQTGLCYLRNTIYNEVLNFNSGQTDIITEKGYSTLTLTGIINEPFQEYTYRVITCENTGLPVIVGSPFLTPKRYGKDFNLITTTPPTILAASTGANYIDTNIWQIEFAITGGYIPRSGEFLEIEVDGNIHTFSRLDNITPSGLSTTLTSFAGINWTGNYVTVKVFDSIGQSSMNFNISS